MANPANWLISEKLPKWHLLTHALCFVFVLFIEDCTVQAQVKI
jgi:hypothetical protein